MGKLRVRKKELKIKFAKLIVICSIVYFDEGRMQQQKGSLKNLNELTK